MGAWDNLSIREKADMMRAAIRNGITTLPEIKQAYNEFAEGGNIYGGGGQKKSGGSFYQTHRARWFNFLCKKGINPVKAERLASYFSAQDALESGHGTSSAARQKNNYGGMQRLDKKTNKMVNVSYGSIDDYMNAKWKMMNNRFGRALNAKSIQEYANILNDPKYHGKGYMYGLYEGYRDGQPLDVARQTKYMNNYTKIMMDIAGEKGFKGAAVPEGIGSDDLSIVQPENPYTQFIPFEPFNPQAFNNPQAFVAPTREQFEVEQPIVEAAKDYAYSPEQLEKEERRQGLNNLSFILGMMNGGNGNSFADTIGMLTGNIVANGGKIHIKPENRGKFTALKKRTGHSATWFKEHGTPAQKKMATFALNARHWKRGLGGNLYLFGGDDDNNPRPVTTGGAGYIPPVVDDPVAQTRKYLYTHILPISDYNIKETINGALEGEFEYRKRNEPKFDYEKEYPKNTDYTTIGGTKAPLSVVDGIWADYLQIPQKDRKKFVGPTIQQSKYKPSSGGRSDINYYSLPLTGGAKSLLVKEGMGLPIGKNKVTDTLEKYGNTVFNLGDHTIGRGKDNKGDYISYYDVFDLNPFSDKYNGTDIPLLNKLNDASFGIGKPVHIYDRIYLDDYYGVPSPYRGGIYLPEVTITGKKRRKGRKHGYGGHIYDGTTEDSQLMNVPYAGELPEVTVMPRRIANKAWDKIQERWVGDMPTYYAVNPETGKEEMLREIGNGKYSTYDDKHVFDVLGAEAAKKQREQWIKNGGNASDFDKVMLGTLGLGLAPIALPEIAAGVGTALANPYVDAGLTSYFGAHGLNHAINEGIDGWGDAAMTALELTPLGRLARPLWNAAKSTRNFIPTLESNMSGVRYAYNRNPELANIGTLEDYNDYLKTVFPESKVKDINYHMGPKGLQELKPSTGKVYNTNPDARGIYVTPDKSYAQRLRKYTTDRLEKPSFLTYLKRNLTPGGWNKANDAFTDIYPVMIDTKNPLLTKGTWTWGIKDKKYQSLMGDYDAIVNSGPKWYQNFNSMPETIVPKTEQSLILGSDADVVGFRRFMSNPQITAENAANITPEQWTAAQDAAIARGDMAEAQRLRDLHFKVSAPTPYISKGVYLPSGSQPTLSQADYYNGNNDLVTLYHSSVDADNLIKEGFDGVEHDLGRTKGEAKGTIFASANPDYAADYSNLYIQEGLSTPDKVGLMELKVPRGAGAFEGNEVRLRPEHIKEITKSAYEKTPWLKWLKTRKTDSNLFNIKSADAVTFDDNGVRIPLGERDNFNINDIRYGLLPFGIGLTGYGLYNSGK